MNKNLLFTKEELESIKSCLEDMVSERYCMGDSASENDKYIYSLIDDLDVNDKNIYDRYIEILIDDLLVGDFEVESYVGLLDPKSLFEYDDEFDEDVFLDFIKKEYGFKY